MLPLTLNTPSNSRAPIQLPMSDTVYNIILEKNVQKNILIPTSSTRCIIQYDVKLVQSNVYVKVQKTQKEFTIPTTDIINGTGSNINPLNYCFMSTDRYIGFISDQNNTVVSISFYL